MHWNGQATANKHQHGIMALAAIIAGVVGIATQSWMNIIYVWAIGMVISAVVCISQ